MIKIKVLIGMLAIFSLPTLAQQDQYLFNTLTIEDGLASNNVICLMQDHTGFVWIGTRGGLNRFDGEEMLTFKSREDSLSLNDNYINVLLKDSIHGNFYVGTKNGLNYYIRDENIFTNIRPDLFADKLISDIKFDQKGNLYVVANGLVYSLGSEESQGISRKINAITENSLRSLDFSVNGNFLLMTEKTFYVYSPLTNKVNSFELLDQDTEQKNWNYNTLLSFCQGEDGAIWINAKINSGVFYIPDEHKQDWQHITSLGNFDLPDRINELYLDKEGNLWFLTKAAGLFVYYRQSKTVQQIKYESNNSYSIDVDANFRGMLQDQQANLWFPTEEQGIYVHYKYRKQFSPYAIASENFWPARNRVSCFYEDDNNILWIGTDRGGMHRFDMATQEFKSFYAKPLKSDSIEEDDLFSSVDGKANKYTTIDKLDENTLVLGTFGGGLYLFDIHQEKFTYFRENERDTFGLKSNYVKGLHVDHNFIWVATNLTLQLFYPGKGVFYPDTKIELEKIRNIVPDNNDNLWFLSDRHQLKCWNRKNDKITYFDGRKKNRYGLQNANFLNMLHDSKGNYWFTTKRNGLVFFQPQDSMFYYFGEDDGLVTEETKSIVEDENGLIWVSSEKGLSKFQYTVKKNSKPKLKIKHYFQEDGLQDHMFYENAGLKLHDGRLAFGGKGGFNLFYPKRIQDNPYVPPVVFTDFELINLSSEQEQEAPPIEKHVNETEEVVLKHHQSSFTIRFAALNYFQANRNRYAYRLEGLGEGLDKWNYQNDLQSVTYNILPPGEYTFKVKASNNDGIWNEEGRSLNITILPPLWQTWWAYLLYIVAAAIALLFLLKYAKAQRNLKIKQFEMEKLQQLNAMKMEFFTNISHEIRTPLTLIDGPASMLLKGEDDEATLVKYYQLIKHNTTRLLRLVNQLLDLRKLEIGGLTLQETTGDVVYFIKETLASFQTLAQERKLGFRVKSNVDALQATFDHDKLEKILYNLLSNAFKSTDAGFISVKVVLNELETQPSTLTIKVDDTGVGIPSQYLDKIFDQFFQVPRHAQHTLTANSGIGLSYTKELVALIGGSIQAESEVGKGSTFTVQLPINRVVGVHTDQKVDNYKVEDETPSHQGKPIVLIVDDNPGILYFLKSNMKELYQVQEASDGSEALDKALKLVPDIIISDIMMPRMDGMAFCKAIKTDVRTSHIPLLLLTAKTSSEDQFKGILTGADAYIIKPFNIDLLLVKIHNLLTLRSNIRKKYSTNIMFDDVSENPVDKEFYNKLINNIKKYLHEPDFSPPRLEDLMGMSQSVLYRKVKALTGTSPIKLITQFRIQKAKLLLEKQHNISEVSYQVGFSDPDYFSKIFKKLEGTSPSEFKKRIDIQQEQLSI